MLGFCFLLSLSIRFHDHPGSFFRSCSGLCLAHTLYFPWFPFCGCTDTVFDPSFFTPFVILLFSPPGPLNPFPGLWTGQSFSLFLPTPFLPPFVLPFSPRHRPLPLWLSGPCRCLASCQRFFRWFDPFFVVLIFCATRLVTAFFSSKPDFFPVVRPIRDFRGSCSSGPPTP